MRRLTAHAARSGNYYIYLGDLYRFDPPSMTWSALAAAGPAPSARSGFGFASDGAASLYVFGGRTAAGGVANDFYRQASAPAAS